MKYVSQALLEATYKKYNKKYFGNSLPKDIDLRFGHTQGDLGYQLGEEIVLNKSKAYRRDSIWKGTLLHELVHLKVAESNDHGPKFQKEMLRLAKAGAFKGIW
jgi:predicted metal-dependent hydrolase